MLKLQFDWFLYMYITFEVPKKMSSRTLQVRGTSLKRSKYQTRQEYLDISKSKLTFLQFKLKLTMNHQIWQPNLTR